MKTLYSLTAALIVSYVMFTATIAAPLAAAPIFA